MFEASLDHMRQHNKINNVLGLPCFGLNEFPPVNETVRQFYEEQCLVLGTVKLLLALSQLCSLVICDILVCMPLGKHESCKDFWLHCLC